MNLKLLDIYLLGGDRNGQDPAGRNPQAPTPSRRAGPGLYGIII